MKFENNREFARFLLQTLGEENLPARPKKTVQCVALPQDTNAYELQLYWEDGSPHSAEAKRTTSSFELLPELLKDQPFGEHPISVEDAKTWALSQL